MPGLPHAESFSPTDLPHSSGFACQVTLLALMPKTSLKSGLLAATRTPAGSHRAPTSQLVLRELRPRRADEGGPAAHVGE